MRPYFFIFSVLAFFCLSSYGQKFKLFQNSYVSFEILDGWDCKAFGTDWVCHSQLQKKKVEALITSTAKIAGQYDTLDEYLSYLQQPKTWSNSKQEQLTSQKIKAGKVFINKFPWVDSIHKNSEIKSYISRYAGTVCCKDSSSQLGILVVLSAHQEHYKKYSSAFIRTVNSLKVMDIEKALSKVREAQAVGAGDGMAHYLEGLFEDDSSENLDGYGAGSNSIPWGGVLGASGLAGLGYWIMKRRKKRRPAKKSRRR